MITTAAIGRPRTLALLGDAVARRNRCFVITRRHGAVVIALHAFWFRAIWQVAA